MHAGMALPATVEPHMSVRGTYTDSLYPQDEGELGFSMHMGMAPPDSLG